MVEASARAGLGKFDATGRIPCAQSKGQPMGQCDFGVSACRRWYRDRRGHAAGRTQARHLLRKGEGDRRRPEPGGRQHELPGIQAGGSLHDPGGRRALRDSRSSHHRGLTTGSMNMATARRNSRGNSTPATRKNRSTVLAAVASASLVCAPCPHSRPRPSSARAAGIATTTAASRPTTRCAWREAALLHRVPAGLLVGLRPRRSLWVNSTAAPQIFGLAAMGTTAAATRPSRPVRRSPASRSSARPAQAARGSSRPTRPSWPSARFGLSTPGWATDVYGDDSARWLGLGSSGGTLFQGRFADSVLRTERQVSAWSARAPVRRHRRARREPQSRLPPQWRGI